MPERQAPPCIQPLVVQFGGCGLPQPKWHSQKFRKDFVYRALLYDVLNANGDAKYAMKSRAIKRIIAIPLLPLNI